MTTKLSLTAPFLLFLGVMAVIVISLGGSNRPAQAAPLAGPQLVAIDTYTGAAQNPANGALSPINSCVSIPVGGTATVDVVVDSIPTMTTPNTPTAGEGLGGFGGDILFNGTIIRFIAPQSVALMLAADGGYVPFEVVDSNPDADGDHNFNAADLSTNYEDGAGVLARFTIEGLAVGISPLTLDDVTAGSGFLTVADSTSTAYDSFTQQHGQVAVGQPCPTPTPTPSPTPSPSPTPTPTPTPTPLPTPSPSPTPSGPYTQVTVNKDFSDTNSATVSITLVCTGNTVVVNGSSTKPATEASPAVFIIASYTPSDTCTATEDTVPTGYTANQADCFEMGIVAGSSTFTSADGISVSGLPTEAQISCTIFNNENTIAVTVSKDFTLPAGCAVCDDSLPTNIAVALVCTGFTVEDVDPNFDDSDDAEFIVHRSVGTVSCTATETVPAGYTADESACTSFSAQSPSASCTITNTQNNATFDVSKDFSDDDTGFVTIQLSCTSGSSFAVSGDDSASEADDANFLVYAFNTGATCTATESAVPLGYAADQSDCASVALTSGSGASCTIVNNTTDTVTVFKDFIPDNPSGSVQVSLTCTSGTITPANPVTATEAAPAVFTVTGFSPGATCAATEAEPAGYTKNESSCTSIAIGAAQGAASDIGPSCTLYNSLNVAGFFVNKVYNSSCLDAVSATGQDFNPCLDDVAIQLTCTSGTIEVLDGNASYFDSAEFVITGFNSTGTTCTATETVPPGYTGDISDCANVPVSLQVTEVGTQEIALFGCTIYNSYNETDVLVYKDFQDDNTDSVTVYLNCTSGIVTPGSAQASEASPAEFHVAGFNVGATCTAFEDPVPGDYSMNNSDCQALQLVPDPAVFPNGDQAPESCTIINSTSIIFTVYKDFVPNNPDSSFEVTVQLDCDNIDGVNVIDGGASEAEPADFEIFGTSGASVCTASEDPVEGWDQSPLSTCTDVFVLETASCLLVNIPDQPTPTPSPGPTDSPGPTATPGPVTPTPTPSPTAVVTPSPTATPSPTPTASPTPSPSPTIRPTQEPGSGTPAPTQSPSGGCAAVLTKTAEPGEKVIEVSISSGCDVGQFIVINDGGSNEEEGKIVGRGSLILECPLKVRHNVGEAVKSIPGPVAACATTVPSKTPGALPTTGGNSGGASSDLTLAFLGLLMLILAVSGWTTFRRMGVNRR